MANDTTRMDWKTAYERTRDALTSWAVTQDSSRLTADVLAVGMDVLTNPPADESETVTSLQRELAYSRTFVEDIADTLGVYHPGAGTDGNMELIRGAIKDLKALQRDLAEAMAEIEKQQAQNKSLFGNAIYHQDQHFRFRDAIYAHRTELVADQDEILSPYDKKLYAALEFIPAPAPSDVKGEERIKELEAERDEAIGELSAERDLCDKWELANREAERLRKAIGEQPLYAFVVDFPKKDEPYYMRVHDRWMIAPNDFSNNQWEVYRRWSPPGPAALTPSPTAASGEKPAMESAWLIETHIGGTPVWYTSNNPCRHFTTDACAADKFSGKDEAEKFASDIGLPRDWKATEHGFDSSPVPAADYLNKMADAEDAAGDISIGTSTPATETQGNAQHHSEGAKILKGGSGSSAAESEGGDWEEQCNGLVAETEVERLEQCIAVYERSCTQWAEQCNRLIAEHSALSARLAACEERCRELEAGIEAHESETRRSLTKAGQMTPWQTDVELWSLLAPKAGGETQA